jgi:hypothetical protein
VPRAGRSQIWVQSGCNKTSRGLLCALKLAIGAVGFQSITFETSSVTARFSHCRINRQSPINQHQNQEQGSGSNGSRLILIAESDCRPKEQAGLFRNLLQADVGRVADHEIRLDGHRVEKVIPGAHPRFGQAFSPRRIDTEL